MAQWEQLLKQAERHLEEGRPGDALQLCDRACFAGDDALYQSALMRGRILLEIGDTSGALSCFDSIASLETKDAEVDCARGTALFELAQFPEAQSALQSAIREDPNLADAHYLLGLIAEFVGSGEEGRWFREAYRIDPERFSPSPQLTNDEFSEVIEEAVSGMDESFQQALEQIPIVVAELPLVNELKHLEPVISPLSLAMVVGTIVDGYVDETVEPVLFLFKRNIERAFRDREGMISATRIAIQTHFSEALGVDVL